MTNANPLSTKTILLNCMKHKVKHVVLTRKAVLFVLLVCLATFLANSKLAHIDNRFLNMWDLIFDMLYHPYYQLFLFLLFFLFVLSDICDDRPITLYVLLRLNKKSTWLLSKIFLILLISTLYTLVYLCIITLISLLLYGYSIHWSPGSSNLYHGELIGHIQPVTGFILLAIRYVLSIWFLSILYLFVYASADGYRIVKAVSVTVMLLVINHLFAYRFFVSYAPFLYIHNGYLVTLRLNENGFQSAMVLNAAAVSPIVLMLLVLWMRKSKLEFGGS
jgi:hypothetical protein